MKNPCVMLKLSCLSLLFSCFLLSSLRVQAAGNADTLINILQVKDKISREKRLTRYIKSSFQDSPANALYAHKISIIDMLEKYNTENKEAFEYFTDGVYQGGLLHWQLSENAFITAVQLANKGHDDYLTYNFLNSLAYAQTEEGNVIGAVSSYRIAKKEAIKLNDTNLQMVIDIDISDVFYKNNFYNQSLSYLNEALSLLTEFWPDDQRVKNVIYYNKAENFFRMEELDSLELYNEKLKTSKANTFKLYTYKKRTDYYLCLLDKDYKKAISLIHAMKNDGGYKFENLDVQNLADAYYKNGQPDSAKIIINQLLSTPSEASRPEIKYHLYDVLGRIAEQQGDYKAASDDFKLSLEQFEDIMKRLTTVDNISSLIKVDEIKGYYSLKDETYKRERSWLIMAVTFAVIIIVVIALLYRTIKQKRHYEKLLFTNKKEELAFINSHEVRKHLTNILGLIDLIKHSDNKKDEYMEAEDHLFDAAENLDKSIKNISEKLSD